MHDRNAITIIDTGYVRPGLCAAYLVESAGRAALIDCGTATCAQTVLDAIDAAGVPRDAVDWLLVTHVHLDHAGAAGPLIRALPNARLVVHPRGAPHMIDPTKLIAGAKAVYGEAMFERDHAGMLPVAEDRVVVAEDAHVVELAGRPLLCIDTPGHALHHYSVWDAATRSWFAGDTFGLSYRELDTSTGAFTVPTTSPVQFDPDQMHASIDKLLATSPVSIRIAHYGEVTGCERLAADLHVQIDAMVTIAQAAQGHDDRHARIVDGLTQLYTARAAAHGIDDAAARVHGILGGDIVLNAQGLEVWLDRQAR
ncbi:MBL fold metallo-hydrolase [Luteimonas sp. XNQY3]|nr:MBL fold metallo-hydrolase [Luteimonas sp. XNQY3]MCD9005706.1 MBL fold metallo-hydrolase [Luteimonas sp. XNQY3]